MLEELEHHALTPHHYPRGASFKRLRLSMRTAYALPTLNEPVFPKGVPMV